MTRPYALFALILAILPWLKYFSQRNKPERIAFAPMRLLANARRKRTLYKRRVALACARSALIVAVALLWAEPFAHKSPAPTAPSTPLVSTSGTRVLIVDAANASPREEPSVAEYLALALQPELDLRRAPSGSRTLQWQVDDNDYTLVDYATWSLTPGRDAERFDLIIFAQPSGLSQLDSQKILTARAGGASILIWPGLDLQASVWQEWLQSDVAPGVEVALQDFSVDAQVQRQTALTVEEQVFRAGIADFNRAGLDAPPVRSAWVCRGAGALSILRDKVHTAPIFTQIADRVYWCGVSPQHSAGELAFLPAFPSFVRQVVQTALGDGGNYLPMRTHMHAMLFLWGILAFALLLEFFCWLEVGGDAGYGA